MAVSPSQSFAASHKQNRFTLFSPPLAKHRALSGALWCLVVLPCQAWRAGRCAPKQCISDIARRWHHFREGPGTGPGYQSFWRWTLLGRQHRGWGDVRLQVSGHDVRPRRKLFELREYRGFYAISAKLDDLLRNLYQFTWTIDNADPAETQRWRQRKHFDIERLQVRLKQAERRRYSPTNATRDHTQDGFAGVKLEILSRSQPALTEILFQPSPQL